MSNGRSERRMARTVKVEVRALAGPTLQETTLTENVSGRGARVLMRQRLPRRQEALLISLSDGAHAPAKVVYCQRLADNRFAVGLELARRVEAWARAY